MADFDPSGSDWTVGEIDLIVADYFDMLALDLGGQPFNKAERNRALQSLTRRSKGSIEFKHQNISAVLAQLGMPWVSGYKPMANFQKALLEGIERVLSVNYGKIAEVPRRADMALAEEGSLHIEAPPPLIPVDLPLDQNMERLVRKFDPALRDARNRTLGRLGEERIFKSEIGNLIAGDRSDLASKVKWVSEEEGDGAGYDIRSFDVSGNERLIEVKTTRGGQTTPFFISENERALSEERTDSFKLVRVYDFSRVPRAFELVPPLSESVILRPATYKASFQ